MGYFVCFEVGLCEVLICSQGLVCGGKLSESFSLENQGGILTRELSLQQLRKRPWKSEFFPSNNSNLKNVIAVSANIMYDKSYTAFIVCLDKKCLGYIGSNSVIRMF